jgi:hypothetical protein
VAVCQKPFSSAALKGKQKVENFLNTVRKCLAQHNVKMKVSKMSKAICAGIQCLELTVVATAAAGINRSKWVSPCYTNEGQKP